MNRRCLLLSLTCSAREILDLGSGVEEVALQVEWFRIWRSGYAGAENLADDLV